MDSIIDRLTEVQVHYGHRTIHIPLYYHYTDLHKFLVVSYFHYLIPPFLNKKFVFIVNILPLFRISSRCTQAYEGSVFKEGGRGYEKPKTFQDILEAN